MIELLFLLIVGLVIWAVARKPQSKDDPALRAKVYQVNKQWMDYIAAQYRKAKTENEKKLLVSMLQDLQKQGMPSPAETYTNGLASSEPFSIATPQSTAAATVSPGNEWQVPEHATASTAKLAVDTYRTPTPVATPVQRPALDNTSILLYFSAFLLVAAAGLFVAFGSVSGGVKTFIIALVALFLYALGFWVWYGKPLLRQAGMTFIALGIILAPLVGVAAYVYTFRGSGEVVWLITSLACLGLYTHALWALKNPLLEYVLIGTFVSLFESAVSVIDLPVYYYGWALAAVGILIQIMQIASKREYTMDAPTSISANVLLPLSLLVSLWMVPKHGATQLGVSLLFGALYYGLVAWRSADGYRQNAAVAAHSMGLAAIALLTYGLHESWPEAALALLIFALPQLVLIMLRSGKMIESVATVLLSSLVLTIPIAWEEPKMALVSALALGAVSVVCWWRQRRAGCYQLAVGALITAILIGVLRIAEGSDMGLYISILSLSLLASQVTLLYFLRGTTYDNSVWRAGFQALAVTTLAIAMIAAFFVTPAQVLFVVTAAASILLPLVYWDNKQAWSLVGGLVFVVTLLVTVPSEGHWLAAILLLLFSNVGILALSKQESNRWLIMAAGLLLPVGVGRLILTDVDFNFYSIVYFVFTVLFVSARWLAIKRSNFTETGMAYSAGYALAGIASIALSVQAWQWLPILICIGLGLLMLFNAHYIEKQPVLAVAFPVLLQVGLWLVYEPQNTVLTLSLSASLALLGYLYGAARNVPRQSTTGYIQITSLILLYAPLLMYFGGRVWWPMPWILLAAGAATLHYVRHGFQNERELAGGVILLGVWALMYFYGVRNVQAYTHVLAALFAGYAFWRARRGEKENSDKYVITALASATVPLVLQALFGTAGDLYGWWLLIEQVAIMLLGMALGNKLMVRWGLYVALASVLYQLRGLGWAALAVLAVFLMVLAIYRLQKHSASSGKIDENPPHIDKAP